MKEQQQKHQVVPLSNSIADACRRMGIGRTTIFALIRTRELRSFKLGQRTLIPESELQRLIAERMEAAA